jgi:hypothetical protein
MVLPLFLMAGGAANEYKATLRAESEAQAQLNEAAITAETNRQNKRNLKEYGNIDVELPTSGDLYGMSNVQKQRSNADFYMNWSQLPSNVAMLQANDKNWNDILKGDIVRSFTDSIFQATEGDTAGVKDTYTKYDYEHLKESWPELYEDLNKLNPWLLPNINLRNGIDMAEAFMDADKAYDIIEGKEGVDPKKPEDNIYHVDHEAIFGQDYAKNILTSQMYGGMSEEKYTMLKANKKKYQYTSIISSLTWRRDNENMDTDVWGQELAQVKTFYNLTDKEVIGAMAHGMRKKTFDTKGSTVTINKFKEINAGRYTKITDAKGGYGEIKKDVDKIRGLLDGGAKTGMFGKLSNILYGVGITGSKDNPQGELENQIGYLKGIINDIATNDGQRFGLDEDEQTNFTIDHGSMKGTSQGSLDSSTSNNNLIARLQGAVDNLEKVKKNQGQAGYSKGDGNPNIPLSSKYYQAQLETLQIYLAYKIALTEQGSGGKAVSDKDFDNALRRVGDTWWINADQAKSRLDLVMHKASSSSIYAGIHAEYGSTGMSDRIEEYYEDFKNEEEKYVKSLRNYFIMKKDARMTERAEKLLTTFSSWGETYGDKIDWDVYDEEGAGATGSFWTLTKELNEQEKAQVASVESKIKEFTNIINAGDGTVTEEIINMAKGFKSMYSNKHQDSTESLMTSFAKMLKNGVEYEEALTAIGEVYQMPKNTSWISSNFIDLQHQGRFDSILGKDWYKKPRLNSGQKPLGPKTQTLTNPSNPSPDRIQEWRDYMESNNFQN